MATNATKFKPMLSASLETEDDWKKLRYPVWSSPKIDGIRCLCHPELGVVTRSLKSLPNKYVRSILSHPMFHYMDGELIVGKNFQATSSAVMSHDGTPDFIYHVFDHFQYPLRPFSFRREMLLSAVEDITNQCIHAGTPLRVQTVPQHELRDEIAIDIWEQGYIDEGYEGMMIRCAGDQYKFGRSTMKEGYLIKLKRFTDSEATIIGFEPLERNTNPPTRDLLGNTVRSSHQAGKVADDLLGKLLVRDTDHGDFSIGSGFDTALRTEIWHNQEAWLGKIVKFKYLKHGTKDLPRHPIYLGIRED